MPEGRPAHTFAPMLLAALVNLNRPASYVHSGFFSMSVSNVVVIGLMIVVFAAAIAVPFRRHRGDDR
jgi:hypothetical protein